MNTNKTHAAIRSFFVTLCLHVMASYAARADQEELGDQALTVKISKNYLKSFPIAQSTIQGHTVSKETKQQDIRKVVCNQGVRLARSTQCKIALRTIFAGIEHNQVTPKGTLLNYNAWNDLNIFAGSSTNPGHHLLSRINKTTTVLGECALATLLVTPTHDIPTLLDRQETIKFLLDQPNSLAELKQLLHNYSLVEQRLLSLWTHTDPLRTEAYVTYMNNRFFSSNPAVNKVTRRLRSRVFFRNIRDIYGEFLMLPLSGVAFGSVHYLGTNAFGFGKPSKNLSESFSTLPFFIPGYSIVYAIKNYIKAKNVDTDSARILPFFGVALTNGLAIWRGYCGVKCYKEYNAVFRNLANRMRDVQVFMQTIQQLSERVAAHPALEAAYGASLTEIRALLKKSEESSEVGIMLHNFLHMQFEDWSYFSGNNAKLLATYSLFEEHKDCLKMAMYGLGKLDSFVGIATLLQESQTRSLPHGYSFPKFLDRMQSKKPAIQLNAIWNPLLDPQTVISNDLAMDTDHVRNMVLCGPNAGGKSSFLSAVAINLLLAQTFGIVAAHDACLTPFNTISTYIEIGDNIASGDSLFMVEVDRTQQHIRGLEQAKPDEFVFAIFDEPFAGTNPVEAGASAYSILAYMAKYPNAIHIVASHYPILMRLEGNFPKRNIKNFKVFITEGNNGALNYTYKIVPGESTQTVALKILAQEGYDKGLIKEAEEIVSQLKKTNNSAKKTAVKAKK
ncbi:MAG: hypothetical protein K2X94_00190 [Amoebophilaceae bacterium]|nr:hypothetical protein [Amoebophilaceae bacterium]